MGRFGLSGAHQTAPIKQLSDGLRNRWVFPFLVLCFGASVFCCPLSRFIYIRFFVLLLSLPSSYTHFWVLSCELCFLVIILEPFVCSSTIPIHSCYFPARCTLKLHPLCHFPLPSPLCLVESSSSVSVVFFYSHSLFLSSATRGPMNSYPFPAVSQHVLKSLCPF